MNPKLYTWIGAAGLLGVAVVPAIVAAGTSREPTETTYKTEGRVARSAQRVVDAARAAASTIVLDETFVWATRSSLPVSTLRAEAAAPVDDCPAWRPLVAGPRARAAEPSRVRACVPPELNFDPPPAASPFAAPPSVRPAMTFVFAPAEPGRQP